MDRFDCQFLMALATFVHLQTFVINHGTTSEASEVARLLSAAGQLSAEARSALASALTEP